MVLVQLNDLVAEFPAQLRVVQKMAHTVCASKRLGVKKRQVLVEQRLVRLVPTENLWRNS